MTLFSNTDSGRTPLVIPANRQILSAYVWFSLAILIMLGICFTLGLDTLAAGHSRTLRLVQLSLVTILSFGFLLYLRQHVWPDAAAIRISYWPSSMFGVGCGILGLLGAVFIATVVLQSVPLSGDEGAYLFQADMFAHGRLWEQPSPIQRYIAQYYIFPIGDKLVSQYPPGWPAVLSAAETIGLPTVLVNPIIGALTIVAVYRFAAAQYDKDVALLTALIITVSAFFLFNSGSFYSGSVATLFGVLFVGSAASFIDRPGVRAAIGIGFWFSAIALTRHLDAVLFAAPVAVVLLWRGTAGHWKLVPIAAAAAVPLFGVLLYYYWRLTGNPLVMPQLVLDSTNGMLGPHWHAMRATELLMGRLVELEEWVSPPFVFAFLWALLQKIRNRSIRFFDLYGPVFLAGYWLFWADGTFRWGPRYIYPAFPFMALIVAESAWNVLRSRRGAVFAHLVFISTVVSLLQVPFLAARGRELISQAQDIYHQVRDAGIHNAVVVALSGTGMIWHIDVGDLVRNGLTLDKDVIYAHGLSMSANRITQSDTERTVQALRAYFPTRDIWLYERDEDQVYGKLVKAEDIGNR